VTRSGSEANDLQFGRAIDARQNLIDAAHHVILDQVLRAALTLQDRKALDDDNADLAQLERHIRQRRR
jgi:hypothetical protein